MTSIKYLCSVMIERGSGQKNVKREFAKCFVRNIDLLGWKPDRDVEGGKVLGKLICGCEECFTCNGLISCEMKRS